MLYANSKAYYKASQYQVVRSFDGRIIGHLEGDMFIKPVIGSKHQLRQPPAWAVDAEAFDQHIKPEATMFRVKDSETGTIYEVSVAYFDQHKGEFDRGFGRQYFLPLTKWQTKHNGNGQRQLNLWDSETPGVIDEL